MATENGKELNADEWYGLTSDIVNTIYENFRRQNVYLSDEKERIDKEVTDIANIASKYYELRGIVQQNITGEQVFGHLTRLFKDQLFAGSEKVSQSLVIKPTAEPSREKLAKVVEQNKHLWQEYNKRMKQRDNLQQLISIGLKFRQKLLSYVRPDGTLDQEQLVGLLNDHLFQPIDAQVVTPEESTTDESESE